MMAWCSRRLFLRRLVHLHHDAGARMIAYHDSVDDVVDRIHVFDLVEALKQANYDVIGLGER